MSKGPDAFRTISEVAEDLDIPQHVLRFWETRFAPIRPLKRGGGRRYYRPDDVELLKGIRQLLYGQGYTIKGVQRILKEDGPRFVQAIGRGEQAAGREPTAHGAGDAPDDDVGAIEVDEATAGWDGTGPAGGPMSTRGDLERVGSSFGFAPEPIRPDHRERLAAALDELVECERILRTLRER